MIKNQRNKDGKEHGYWEYYYANDTLSYKGNLNNGKPHGYCESYWSHYKVSKVYKKFHI